MAAVRPIVLVYQDFATVSVPVSLPDLNVCVVGPAYSVLDYATDKADILVQAVGSKSTAPSGAASTGPTLTDVAIPSLVAGGVVDAASLAIYLDEAYAEIQTGSDGAVTADQNTFSSATPFAGVQPGDRLVVGDLDTATGIVTVAKTVLAVAADKLSLTLTTNFTKTGVDSAGVSYTILDANFAVSALKYRVERPLSGVAADQLPTLNGDKFSVTALTTKVSGVAKPVTYGKAYLQYRALRTDLSVDLNVVGTKNEVTALLGKIDERNPLAVGTYLALQNSNKSVQCYAVTSDDLAGHTAARDRLNGRKDVYAIVPLSMSVPVVQLWKAHVRAVSAPAISKFRIVLGSTDLPKTKAVFPAVGTQAGTVEVVDGTKFRLLDNTATFMTSGVVTGDVVTISTTKFIVNSVISENRLELLGVKPAGPAIVYAITRNFTREQQVTELAAITSSLKDSRCTMVWPDQCYVADVKNAATGTASVQPGYYLAAAVGGMVAGLPPHQGFTYIGLAGISQLANSNTYFYDDQLDALSSAGWYVIVQDTPKSVPYSLHELTTDTTTLESGELMVVKNFDFVSLTLRNALVGFLGVYNVTKDTIDFLRAALEGAADQLRLRRYAKIGAPLLSLKIESINVLAGSKDQVEVFASVEIPRPLNRVGLHLTA